MSPKDRAAAVSLAYNVVATAAKAVGAIFTGSVSLASEAAHSAVDILASGVAWLSVRYAARPPDDEHPYGHGKMEAVTGLAESILLIVTAVAIFVTAIGRLFTKGEIVRIDLALAIVVASCVTSFLAGRYVLAVARRESSVALVGNGQHLLVDFWTSLGVLVGLLITRLTGWGGADAAVAILLSLFMLAGVVRVGNEALQQLLDRLLPDDEMARVAEIIEAEPGVLSYHRLRGRHSGSVHEFDVHVVVDADWSLRQAHDLADRLEKKICRALAPARAIVHVDPFEPGR